MEADCQLGFPGNLLKWKHAPSLCASPFIPDLLPFSCLEHGPEGWGYSSHLATHGKDQNHRDVDPVILQLLNSYQPLVISILLVPLEKQTPLLLNPLLFGFSVIRC